MYFITYFTHREQSPERQQPIKEPSLKYYSFIYFSLVQCIFTYSRSQYTFGWGLLEIQQFYFAFRSKITWSYIFEASNYRPIILIFFMSEEIKIVVNVVPFLDSFATVIWSRHAMALSPTGNKGRCVTRPNNSSK